MSGPPETVAPAGALAVIATWPHPVRRVSLALRDMILHEAVVTDTGPLSETLKWGQPAYLTEKTRSGTTVRIAHVADDPFPCRMLVHCGTDLVDRFRARHGDTLRFEGNRAICLPAALPLPGAPLRDCIAMALTYHSSKRAAHG